jgi:TRAP-type C4-dicarboxylate transport system substrate-binding protein
MWQKNLLRLALAMMTCCGVLPAAAAEKQVRINLGTLAPRGSVYHQSLQTMVEQWRKAAGGVKLVVYPDGTQGSEADMVRLMNVNALQAGLLTAVGLSKIEPGVVGLQYAPMLFRDLDEVDAIQEQLRPMLEKRLQEKGYEVLFWVNAGWVRYFSRQPLNAPEELKKMKIFVWAGDVVQMDMMRKAGYGPVGLETGDILPGLKTGLINTAALPPIFALAGQLDMNAPHMLDLNWAPLVGACVVKKDAWDKIPAETRLLLRDSATTAGKEIQAKSRVEGDLAVEAMKKRGLTVHPVLPEVESQWRAAAELLYPDIRGQLVPSDIFDEVQRLVKTRRTMAQQK